MATMAATFALRGHEPYRDAVVAARARLAELVGSRTLELRHLPHALPRLYAARCARIALGATAAALGLAAFATLPLAPELAPALLFAAWPLGALLACGAWLIARLAFTNTLRRAARVAHDADARTALARLEELPRPTELALHFGERLETASFSWPLVAAAITLPLTIHALAFPLIFHGETIEQLRDKLVGWMMVSAVVVGHAHIALAIASVVTLARSRVRAIAAQRHDGWKALGIATAASAIPGALLIGIPPFLTFVTGLVFVPPLFWWARHARERERAVARSVTAALFE